MSELAIGNRQRVRRIDLPVLRGVTRALLEDLMRIPGYDFGIQLVTAGEMARLNRTFLRHEGSTDVLTFDYAQTPVPRSRPPDSKIAGNPAVRPARPGPGTGSSGAARLNAPALHGEVVVCLEEVMAQARRFRTAWEKELVRCLVHGVLHLCGYDDRQPAARRRMKRQENLLLGALARRFALSKLARKPTVRA